MSAPKTVSGHLKDLLRRDIMVSVDCVQWLAPDQRDIDRRARPQRLANRYLAACMIVEASKNPAFIREVLDRTEGKVADVVVSGSFQDLVLALEAGRQRLLAPQAAIEGELASLPIVVDSASPIAEESHPVTDPTESDTSK